MSVHLDCWGLLLRTTFRASRRVRLARRRWYPSLTRQGRIYPSLGRIREVSAHIAETVASVAFQRGLARVAPPDDLGEAVRDAMFTPEYPTYA